MYLFPPVGDFRRMNALPQKSHTLPAPFQGRILFVTEYTHKLKVGHYWYSTNNYTKENVCY
jgi:hypothetical protein